jgi:hypothetical protein
LGPCAKATAPANIKIIDKFFIPPLMVASNQVVPLILPRGPAIIASLLSH